MNTQIGYLAHTAGSRLTLQVCKSQAGFYIGTRDENGMPFSRESVQYWTTEEAATKALDAGNWTQRLTP